MAEPMVPSYPCELFLRRIFGRETSPLLYNIKMGLILVFLLTVSFSFGFSDKERDTLLRLIQGLYQDKVYNVAKKKCLEYLQKAPSDDHYREKIVKILFHTLYKSKDKEGFVKAIYLIEGEKLKEDTAKEIFSLGMNLFKDEPEKQAEVVKFYLPYLKGYQREEMYKFLASLYIKGKKWNEILKLPDKRHLNFYKVIALYKLGRYKDLISFTEQMSKFEPEDKDNVLYYRGLGYFSLGDKEKAARIIEAVTFKTPEMVKFLASYYFKKKDYIKAEKYLKILTLEKGYKDYAYYFLGVIEDLNKDYKKALKYYKKAAAYKTDFGKLAKKRITQLKKAGVVPSEKYYSVRIILYSSKNKAEALIKKKNLSDCFVKKYKKFYGVYCGRFESKKDAEKRKKELKNAGFKDAVIDEISE